VISYVRVFVTIFVSAIVCLLYYGVGQDKAGVQDRNGALFFIVLNAGFNALSNISQIFPTERPVFLREVNSGMYRVSSYFSSKIMTEFIPSTFLVILQSCITYWIIGFNTTTPDHFYRFCLIMICMGNQMSGVGYMLGASIADM
jgi:ABC-type multidrug transport system permease subunit